MKFKQPGRSGLLVSDLSLGTMIFVEASERCTSAAEAEQLIQRNLDAVKGLCNGSTFSSVDFAPLAVERYLEE
jgi:hypothetical protein